MTAGRNRLPKMSHHTPSLPSVGNLIHRIEDLRRAGVTHVPKPRATPVTAAVPARAVASSAADQRLASPARGQSSLLSATALPSDASLDRGQALQVVAQHVAACTRCEELARCRMQTVFGVGDPHARLAFLGEAPGADEDRQGEPFVGRAGQLLTDIIEKGLKLRRQDVYIFNILKCRPPENRTPLPQEAANCREYLDRQSAS